MPRETLLDFFHDFAELDDEFLIYDDGFSARRYSYREIAARARGFAAWLREQGIGRDEKIILYGENRPEWIVALWGCLLEGVIAVPIDYRSSAEFVAAHSCNCRRASGSDGQRSRHVRCAGGVRRACEDHQRSNRRDYLYLRRHRRTQGRHHYARQHSRQHCSGGTRGAASIAATSGRSRPSDF